ncbi:ciliary rootlet coiled-coil protein 2-like [Petaurus breviceps papuanus]|uniref:ciliary rootlet coiled-coil protein 2-like n=1 Tax=Petaurus breviceps papuanus TaxID=3040969 RepID=UPI0036DCD02A
MWRLRYPGKLENTVLSPEAKREDRTLTVKDEGGHMTPTPVPARIRQIVTGSLVEDPLQGLWEVPSGVSMQEENQLLQDELSRLEDLLAQTRAERDEFASKHHAVSERMQTRLQSAEQRLRQSEHEYNSDLDEALTRLEEEEQRSSSLSQVNALLREQLEHMTNSNQRLAEEQDRMASSLSRLRDELEQKELRWWKEKESSEALLWKEPRGILILWRHAVVLRSNIDELQAVAER